MAIVEKWNELVETTNAYMNSSTMIDDIDKQSLQRCIAKGNDNPLRQSKMMISIKSTVEDYADSPFTVSRGYVLPDKAAAIVNPALTDFRAALADAFDALGDVGRVMVEPHGRSNYQFYDNGATFASTIVDKAERRANKLHKDGTWAGTKKSLSEILQGGQ